MRTLIISASPWVSLNQAYFDGYNSRRLSYAGNKWKKQIREEVASQLPESWSPGPNTVFDVEIVLVSNWICKNGNVRVSDAESYLKLLNDAVAEVLGVDDSRFFSLKVSKELGSHHECIRYIITERSL